MASNNQNPPTNLNYNCSFKFTFKFNFDSGCPVPPGFKRVLFHTIDENHQTAEKNTYVQKPFFPNVPQPNFASGTYDIIKVKIESDRTVILEHKFFSAKNQLYPDTDDITVEFAVILKSCLDLIKKYASNQSFQNIAAILTFEFSTNANTYYSSSRDIWGNKITTSNYVEIKNVSPFDVMLDSGTNPIDILELFFRLYKYPQHSLQSNVNIDCTAAKDAWEKIFKQNRILRYILRAYIPYSIRKFLGLS